MLLPRGCCRLRVQRCAAAVPCTGWSIYRSRGPTLQLPPWMLATTSRPSSSTAPGVLRSHRGGRTTRGRRSGSFASRPEFLLPSRASSNNARTATARPYPAGDVQRHEPDDGVLLGDCVRWPLRARARSLTVHASSLLHHLVLVPNGDLGSRCAWA
uniref:Uncharacterized protein n=1 Tax=Setaria viridis TaxID=4556 RepID=A0A4V6D1J8_SETVI|nr:hypothetical protein SEVIR_9G328450v2 [Setaria viridis]